MAVHEICAILADAQCAPLPVFVDCERSVTNQIAVHMLISCPPDLAPSKIVQYIKGRSSKLIQEEFPELKKRYWGQHLWARGYFCATVGSVDAETIRLYVERQEMPETRDNFNIIE